ncbi:lipase family protein [Rhodococcus sp. NPDC004095]
MRLSGVLATLVATTLLGTGAAAVPTASAQAQPAIDAFYTPPDGFESATPGSILRERPVELASYSVLPFNAEAWQLLYRTTDLAGQPTATVTTVLRPAGPAAPGGRPLLSYQVAHDSVDPACGPSVAMQAGSGPDSFFTQGEMTFITYALQQGWAVSVPDHEGPAARIGAPREPGYAVLDGVRAAEQFAPLELSASGTPVGLWGYSGGGLVTGWAAQLQPSYAPELNIRGAALGSPVPDPVAMNHLSGTFWAGLQLIGIAGTRQIFPEAAREIDAHLTPAGRAALDEMGDQCVIATVASNILRDNSPYLTVPYAQLMELPAITAAVQEIKLGSAAPTAPVYVYSAVTDEIVPIGTVDHLVDQYCRGGTPVTYRRHETGLHATVLITGASDTLNWLRDRLTGAPTAPGCDIVSTPSTLLSPGAAQTYAETNLRLLESYTGAPIGPR